MAPESASEWAELALVTQRIARQGHIAALRRSDVDLLPPTLEGVLRHILEHPRCRVQDIADALLFAPSNASSAISRLERLGLVTKEPDTEDRRAVRVRATEKALFGRRAIDDLWIEIFGGAASVLDEDERTSLRATLPLLKRMALVMA